MIKCFTFWKCKIKRCTCNFSWQFSYLARYSEQKISCKHDLRAIGRKALGTSEQPVSGCQRFLRQNCRLQSRAYYRAPVAQLVEHRVIMREVVILTPTNTQGLKITEQKVLSKWLDFKSSRRSLITTLVVNNCGALKNPHTIRKEYGTEFRVLWSGLYPSQKHLAWLLCSGIIHDCLAAARGAFHMHSADPVELRPS